VVVKTFGIGILIESHDRRGYRELVIRNKNTTESAVRSRNIVIVDRLILVSVECDEEVNKKPPTYIVAYLRFRVF